MASMMNLGKYPLGVWDELLDENLTKKAFWSDARRQYHCR
jgi:hypothetical protein